jgi:hypothetical protein
MAHLSEVLHLIVNIIYILIIFANFIGTNGKNFNDTQDYLMIADQKIEKCCKSINLDSSEKDEMFESLMRLDASLILIGH